MQYNHANVSLIYSDALSSKIMWTQINFIPYSAVRIQEHQFFLLRWRLKER